MRPTGTGCCASCGRDNPHIRFFDNRRRGYTRCTVIRRRWYTDLRVVDTVERPGAGVRTLASFVVEDGRPGAERACASGTSLEWVALTTTYGGAWVRP